jgi:hypothetical protein
MGQLLPQAASRHEFSMYLGGGIATLQYPVSAYKPGGQAGLGYICFISRQWGIGTGVELWFLNAGSHYSWIKGSYNTYDDSEPFEFRYKAYNYRETQQAWYINIPLMLHFQRPINKTNKFYAALGGKIGIPLSTSYSGKSDSLVTSGYYPVYNVELPGPKFRGFGVFTDVTDVDGRELKLAYMASVEAGVKWGLSNHWALYTGMYADIGLNDIMDRTTPAPQDLPLVTYNPRNPAQYRYNSTMLLQEQRITPVAIGIKLKLVFGNTARRSVLINPRSFSPE